MPADLILCDFKGKTWIRERDQRLKDLDAQAMQIINQCFPFVSDTGDTSPSEIVPADYDPRVR